MEVDLASFADVGFLGVVFLLVIAGRFLRPTYYSDRLEQELTERLGERTADLDRTRTELAACQAEVARLNSYVADRVIPALVRFSDATERRSTRREDGSS